jgi:molybdenum cofactor cytidylyltransferase
MPTNNMPDPHIKSISKMCEHDVQGLKPTFFLSKRRGIQMRIEGVIIAAGRSSRMYPNHKPMMDLHGKTLIERSIDTLLPFCSKIVVVTGYQAESIRTVLLKSKNIELINNDAYNEGMFSSLKVGLNHVDGDLVFFLPGDCPFADEIVYREMLRAKGEIIVPAYHGKPGHPVLFSKRSIQQLFASKRCKTLKEFISRQNAHVIEVDCPGVIWDLDTPEDYANALKYFEKKEREH